MKMFKTCLPILLVLLLNTISVSAHAHMTMDAATTDQFLEQQPAMLPETMSSPSLIQHVFDQEMPVGPDVTAITDPGSDPNAPIDAKLWILLVMAGVFGVYQYKKQAALTK